MRPLATTSLGSVRMSQLASRQMRLPPATRQPVQPAALEPGPHRLSSSSQGTSEYPQIAVMQGRGLREPHRAPLDDCALQWYRADVHENLEGQTQLPATIAADRGGHIQMSCQQLTGQSSSQGARHSGKNEIVPPVQHCSCARWPVARDSQAGGHKILPPSQVTTTQSSPSRGRVHSPVLKMQLVKLPSQTEA